MCVFSFARIKACEKGIQQLLARESVQVFGDNFFAKAALEILTGLGFDNYIFNHGDKR